MPGNYWTACKTSHAPISSAASGKFPRTYRTLCTHQERKPSLAKENQWLKSVSIRWSSYPWFGQAVLSLSKGGEQGLCPFAARYLPSLRPWLCVALLLENTLLLAIVSPWNEADQYVVMCMNQKLEMPVVRVLTGINNMPAFARSVISHLLAARPPVQTFQHMLSPVVNTAPPQKYPAYTDRAWELLLRYQRSTFWSPKLHRDNQTRNRF